PASQPEDGVGAVDGDAGDAGEAPGGVGVAEHLHVAPAVVVDPDGVVVVQESAKGADGQGAPGLDDRAGGCVAVLQPLDARAEAAAGAAGTVCIHGEFSLLKGRRGRPAGGVNATAPGARETLVARPPYHATKRSAGDQQFSRIPEGPALTRPGRPP